MRVGDIYTGNYLKASDVAQAINVTIDGVSEEKVGIGQDATSKLVLTLKGAKRRLVLPKCNAEMLAVIFKTDVVEEWVGRRFCLFPDVTQYQGKAVACLRVRAPQVSGKQAAPEPPPVVDDSEPTDVDTPF